MAAYGTLVAWARAMGHTEAADLLQETLDEEKAADEKLYVAGRRRHQPGRRPRPRTQSEDEEEEEEPVGAGSSKRRPRFVTPALTRHFTVTISTSPSRRMMVTPRSCGCRSSCRSTLRVADLQVGQANPVDRLGQPAA